MTWFWNLSPIRFLDFYLVLLFLASSFRRIGFYRSIVQIVVKVPGRWPNLFKLVRDHKMIFLTWPVMLPAVFALILALIQLIASRLIWPEATRPPNGLTLGGLAEYWWALGISASLGLLMIALDIYGLTVVGQIDRKELEKHFDTAEYWLRSKTAHVVRVFTFGYVNPRQKVATEVQKALMDATGVLTFAFWWITIQIGLRISFGLSLWLAWALTSP